MRRLLPLVLIFIYCFAPLQATQNNPVVLDIGHQPSAKGAQSPDKRINEFDFWLKHAEHVQRVVKKAGYSCIITNRSTPPGEKAICDVIFLNKPDKNGKRYPSRHHPEHIGAGMTCADYAIDVKARCVVFLHLNCTSNKWSVKPPTGLIIHNKMYGKELAESICEVMREQLLDKPGGISNANKGIKAIPRFIGSQPSAGWMNTLDEEKIPAVVFEALYVNHKQHVNYLSKEENGMKLAECIGAGIVQWLQKGASYK